MIPFQLAYPSQNPVFWWRWEQFRSLDGFFCACVCVFLFYTFLFSHRVSGMAHWCGSRLLFWMPSQLCGSYLSEDHWHEENVVINASVLANNGYYVIKNIWLFSSILRIVTFLILMYIRHTENQRRVCIFWRPSVLELVSVATIIGSKVRDHHDMRGPLTFSDVLLNCLSDLSQVCFAGIHEFGFIFLRH